ncbi:NAD(P)-dependent alcohol dehydrogenase [Micromonospora sonneratiae]|uniref:NAD(P)-dependent alcohol dehydrogenase n=1 Tax=Micromonospora sonneratiae TaxID=1184706 RepID=A0ABW3YC29_9ACTN
MRAIVQDRYGPTEMLRLQDVDVPKIGADEVLVRVHASGVDPGVWHLVTGLPYLVRLGFGLFRPASRVPGMDLAGVVEAVGSNVERFTPGDEVFGTGRGSYAEYASAPANRLAPKPRNLTFEQAAAVPISGQTALAAVRDAGQVRPGKRVLVIGAGGGVGTFAVQLAKALGAHVTGMCSTGKLDLVRSIGADEVVDYTRTDITDRGQRYDVVIDTAGNRRLAQLRLALVPTGVLVLVGGEAGTGKWLWGFDRQLRALLLSPLVSQRLVPLLSRESTENLVALTELIEAGALTPVVGRTYPLTEVAEALRHLEDGHSTGKTVVTI